MILICSDTLYYDHLVQLYGRTAYTGCTGSFGTLLLVNMHMHMRMYGR